MENEQALSTAVSASNSSISSTGNTTLTPTTPVTGQAYYPDDGEMPGTSGFDTRSNPVLKGEAAVKNDWHLEVSYSSSDESISSSCSGNDVKYTCQIQDSLSGSGLYSLSPSNEIQPSISGSEVFKKYLKSLGVSYESQKKLSSNNSNVLTNREFEQDLAKEGFWMTHPDDKDDEVLITSPSHYYLVYGSRSKLSQCSNQTALELLHYFQNNAQGEYDVFEKPILGDTDSTPWQQRLDLQRRCEEQGVITDHNISNNSINSPINVRNAIADQQARVSSWLENIGPEVDNSAYKRPSCSDTEVSVTNKRRRRNDGEVLKSSAKRSKSETNVGEERPVSKRNNIKARRRRPNRI